MEDTLIEVKGLVVKSGKHVLLDHINWTVKPGEQWVIFGTNGSGKTTLLSAVAGFRRFSEGTIEIFGEQLSAGNILAMRKRIGWVSNSFFDTYYKNESAIEIILASKTGTLGLDFSVDEHDIGRARSLMTQLGLEDKINMPFSTLSKGERQRVLLARALLCNPEILVLDEPCTGLDIVARERMLALVSEITQESNATVIYVTHYSEELLDDFTHALLLKKGSVFAQGTMEACFTDEAMTQFLDAPARITRDEDGRMRIRLSDDNGEWRLLSCS